MKEWIIMAILSLIVVCCIGCERSLSIDQINQCIIVCEHNDGLKSIIVDSVNSSNALVECRCNDGASFDYEFIKKINVKGD